MILKSETFPNSVLITMRLRVHCYSWCTCKASLPIYTTRRCTQAEFNTPLLFAATFGMAITHMHYIFLPWKLYQHSQEAYPQSCQQRDEEMNGCKPGEGGMQRGEEMETCTHTDRGSESTKGLSACRQRLGWHCNGIHLSSSSSTKLWVA